ncbi:unnamed protein product, partial [Polarella glacialis]
DQQLSVSGFDLALSAAMLTQQCRHLNVLLLDRPDDFAVLCAAVAYAHLMSLVSLLAVGGFGLFVSDVCDARTCPCRPSMRPLTCLETHRERLFFDILELPNLLRSPDFVAAGVDPSSVSLSEPW